MREIDVAVTHWMNGWAGTSATTDCLMIWISAAGVPLAILAVAAQWWLQTDKRQASALAEVRA
jgi:undecaprenyl-diphosphatase